MSTRAVLSFCLVVLFCPPTEAVQAQEEDAAEFVGTYRFAGGRRERSALRDEIDRVADQFGFLARGIARRRMHDDIGIELGVTIARRGSAVTFRFDDRRSIICDGSWQTVDGSGEDLGEGRCSVDGNRLRFDERFDETRTFHVFTPSQEGRKLHMRARLRNPRLPDVVRYRLTYRRVSSP